jgi:hypothetical protein
MAYVPRLPARVDDKGQLRPADPVAWRTYLARQAGRDVWVTVVRQTRQHTDSQRSYYFGVVVETIASYVGESKEETHELLKWQFLKPRRAELLNGKFIEMPPSTKRLTVEEFGAYIDEVVRWAATFLGLYIPAAGDVEVVV